MAKGFMDGYKTYDTSNGFGSPSEWRFSFNERMGFKEAKTILKDGSPLDILGLTANATFDEIKERYKKLAKECHPDKNPNIDRSVFQKLLAAYTVLKKKFGQK